MDGASPPKHLERVVPPPTHPEVIEKMLRRFQFALLLLALSLVGGYARTGRAQDASSVSLTTASAPTASQGQQSQGASPAESSEAAPPTVQIAADEDGFQLRSSDRSFSLRLRGDVQTDGRFFTDDTIEPGLETFYLRLARLNLQGTLFSRFDFKVMPNWGQGRAELQDAFIDARFTPAFGVRAGKFKVPIGLEYLQSPTHMVMIERALPTALVPNRDIGVNFHGDLFGGRLGYDLGLYNGVVAGSSGDADVNRSKDFAARLFSHPFRGTKSPLAGLGIGVAAGTGVQEGTASTAFLPTFRTTGRQTFFRYRTGDGAPAADGRRFHVSPQGYFYHGPFGFLAEYVVSRQEVAAGEHATELTHSAWAATASLLLTGEKATFTRLRVKQPYDPGAGRWGAFEIVARLHGLSLDDATFPTFADPARAARSAFAWAAGVNWYLNSSIRFMLNYEQTRFEAAEGAGQRSTEHLILSRFQIAF